MYSIAFPKMFTSGRTLLVSNKEAAKNNLRLVLLSTKTELFGDPDFGTNLKEFLYEQNSVFIEDMIREEIYTAIMVYVPQVIVNREDITIERDRTNVSVNINYKYITDKEPDMYSISLVAEEG